ncbi:MAG TPA: DUF2235 domain-containing protein [Steroidobacteraceae bacterium]|nr:DUF2235 domain-containing protein [Steroidobacteraceae bacterium]
MARNLVICCDGTNNSLATPLTNVAHIGALADIGDDSRQLAYYDAGVGVDADPRMRSRIGAAISRWSGSAFGTGLVENVEDVYQHLVTHYADGDRVYLFGFSRGAYTVRVLAGLLHNYGLLRKEHAAESGKVVKAFQDLFPRKRPDPDDEAAKENQSERFAESRRIRKNLSGPCPIHFMGLFDTVSSLGWAWEPKSFPNTMTMPNAQIVRHAMALDERRAKFRTNRVKPSDGTDHKQLWFAGVHSDVGGGYASPRNRLARVPLRWMLGESRTAGMLINPDVVKTLDLETTALDDEQAEQNESLGAFWHALEYLPLPERRQTEAGWVDTRRYFRGQGWREIPDTFDAHESLQRRKIAVKNTFWNDLLPKINYRI